MTHVDIKHTLMFDKDRSIKNSEEQELFVVVVTFQIRKKTTICLYVKITSSINQKYLSGFIIVLKGDIEVIKMYNNYTILIVRRIKEGSCE